MSPLTSERNHQIGKLFFYGPLVSLVFQPVPTRDCISSGFETAMRWNPEYISPNAAASEMDSILRL